jgi:small conductance mechanosensitive channel
MNKFLSELLSYFQKIPAVKIFLIIVIGIIVYFVVKFFGRMWLRKIVKLRYKGKDREEIEKRTKTLYRTLTATLKVIIIFLIILLILDALKINLTPFIAGAGVIGLAISFGSQSLVKDFVSGLFILIEDQFRKGDSVKIGNFEGIVEDFTLRKTVLRDKEDNLHYIPNSQITVITNLTKGKKKQKLEKSSKTKD